MCLEIFPLTPERWRDFEKLFGPSGGDDGCWCMFWRLNRHDFNSGKGETNRLCFKKMVEENSTPGLIAYQDHMPVGWCSVSPREAFAERIAELPVYQPIDSKHVWSILCFFIHPDYRNQGIARRLLKEAIQFARANGASTLESFPDDPKGRTADGDIYTGTVKMFQDLGFVEAERRHPLRPIMRYEFNRK
ncbi:GNAT family N-acetyltransferase [Sporolactobacillus vineae]|uniref:GNAT family N-acetyltransferase n=1 Tax=Sporolactobacillus vineae TaxID=444463 RepID=UPI00028A3287|nr:GNAT family N-acetyltransferase [Sporolactobacillus vineae]